MRDTHRMKEKFDLSLDNRQIAGVLIGGLVVMGSVFVLGVVVGKNLANHGTAATAPDLLTALDQKAEEVSLTFQEELTRKQPVVLPPPADDVVMPAVALTPPSAPEPKVELARAEVPAPAPVPAPAAPAPTPRPKLDETVDAAPVATRTAELPEKKTQTLSAAFDRATKPAPAEATKGGAWTLQISSSQSKDEANRFAARLRDRGYAPFIIQAEVAGRGTWYRVRMGSFPSKEAAARYLLDFKRETQLDAFVASSN